MHEFCDGCQCQYKSRNCFGYLAESVEEFGYSKIIRNFFESCHGKGSQDAAGGLLKNQADMTVIRGKAKIRSTRELFEFAENNLKTSRSHACKRRFSDTDMLRKYLVQIRGTLNQSKESERFIV